MATQRSEFRDSLLFWLGNRADATTARLDAWLNDALLDLATQRVEIFSLRSVGTDFDTSAGVYAYARPAGCFTVEYLEDTTSKRLLYPMAGGLPEWILAKQNVQNTYPTRFIETAGQIWLMPIPDTVYTLRPYIYLYPTWSANSNAAPGVDPEWYYGIEQVAKIHAARDLSMSEKEQEAEAIYGRWLASRDTVVRRTARKSLPQRGVSPASAVRRNMKTGV